MQPKMTHNHPSKAFSLIEMMFVIIIIAAISLYAVNIVRSRGTDAVVTSTADTLTQWLQASQNYYAQNKQWPQGWSDLYSGSTQYLPESAGCSKILQSSTFTCPAGTSASCGSYGPICLSFASGQTYQNATFIAVGTPVSDTAMAQKIANLVPNGSYSGGMVYTRAVLPGSAGAGGYFVPEVACSTSSYGNGSGHYTYMIVNSIRFVSDSQVANPDTNTLYEASCSCNNGGFGCGYNNGNSYNSYAKVPA